MGFHTIEEKLFDKIVQKVQREKTIFPITQMFVQGHLIVDVSYGRSAMFLYEVPLKMIASLHLKSLKPNTKFHFMQDQFDKPFILTVASSKRLDKKFRDQLNLR